MVLGDVLLLASFLVTTTSLASSCLAIMALFLGDIPIPRLESCSPTTGVAGMSLRAGPGRGDGSGPSVWGRMLYTFALLSMSLCCISMN